MERPSTEKLRYVFVSPWPVRPGAGVSNVILGLSSAMRDDFDPVIAVSGWDPPTGDQIWLRLPSPGQSFRSVISFVVKLLPNSIRLRRVIRGAAVVNPHYLGLEILPFVLLKRIGLCPKLVISVHGSDVTDILNSSRVSRGLYNFTLKTADVVVACSKSLADKVLQLSPRAKVVPIWNAATPPASIPETRLMASSYLVCVGSYTKTKGQDVLLDAFVEVLKTRPDLKLVMIGGEGPERVPLANMIEELGLSGKVEMLVNLPHAVVWHWIRDAECLILPSRNEGFGICLLEAAMLRTPVVGTRVGGIPELLADGGHGLLCQPDRADCLASAILETISDPISAKARTDAFFKRASGLTWSNAFEAYCRAAGLP